MVAFLSTIPANFLNERQNSPLCSDRKSLKTLVTLGATRLNSKWKGSLLKVRIVLPYCLLILNINAPYGERLRGADLIGVASMQGFHGGNGRVCALLLTFLRASNDRS
jgi:hypothetical protein